MKHILKLLLLALVSVSCTPQTYEEEHRFTNYFYLVNKADMSTIKILTDGKVYLESGAINEKGFKEVPNNQIFFSSDTIFVNIPGDYFYYDGDKTAEQLWKEKEGMNYLKMLNPVSGEHLLSVSVQNY